MLLTERKSESNEDKVLPSGIIIPAGMKEKANMPIEAIVKEVGGGIAGVQMEVEVGETVWYMKDAVMFEVDGMDLIGQDNLIQVESCATKSN